MLPLLLNGESTNSSNSDANSLQMLHQSHIHSLLCLQQLLQMISRKNNNTHSPFIQLTFQRLFLPLNCIQENPFTRQWQLFSNFSRILSSWSIAKTSQNISTASLHALLVEQAQFKGQETFILATSPSINSKYILELKFKYLYKVYHCCTAESLIATLKSLSRPDESSRTLSYKQDQSSIEQLMCTLPFLNPLSAHASKASAKLQTVPIQKPCKSIQTGKKIPLFIEAIVNRTALFLTIFNWSRGHNGSQ